MAVLRSIGPALLMLLLCSSMRAQAAPPAARWTIFHVTGVGQDTWSTWHTETPWPFKVRFKCEHGAVIMNAVNTDTMHQSVSVRAWNVEATQDELERSIHGQRARQNKGFVLPARQAMTLPIHRDVCGAASNSFFFGAVLGV